MSLISGLKSVFNKVCCKNQWASPGSRQQFHIADILSVSTQKYLSDPQTNGFGRLKEHITERLAKNDKKLGDGLEGYSESLSKFMKKELPWLKEIRFPELPSGLSREATQEVIQKFVADVASKYGEYHQVGQMKPSRPRHTPKFTGGRSGAY